jgi:hypothetical protein
VSLTVLSTFGCSDSPANPITPPPPPPVLGSEAGIESITLSKGVLEPAFTQQVRNYGVTLAGVATPNITFTVTLKDPKARLTINKAEYASGQEVFMALVEGKNSIAINTLSEDGRIADLTTITINSAKPNVRLWVLDGIGGAPVKNTTLRVEESGGRVLAESISFPTDQNGSLFLVLDPTRKYNVYAKGEGSAESCFANFDPSRENTLALYCRPSYGGDYFPVTAPIITDIAFATTNAEDAEWKSLPAGTNAIPATLANLAAVKITAAAESHITDQDNAFWYGIQINVDSMPYNGNGVAGNVEQDSSLINLNGKQYFQTIHRFTVPSLQNKVDNKEHWLSVVVYDVASNRTEQRVYMTITDSAASVTDDPNISGIKPILTETEFQTYGITQDLPAVNPAEGPYGISYLCNVAFTMSQAIRGYEVWHSTDDLHFDKVYTHNYATTSTAAQRWVDRGPHLMDGNNYYKVRAFNGNPAGGGYSLFSDSIIAKPLPPFTTQLIEPAHNSVSKVQWPVFKFRITNPDVLGDLTQESETTSGCRFTLYARQKTGLAIINASFEVLFHNFDEYDPYSGDVIGKGTKPIVIFYYGGSWWVDTYFYDIVEIEEDGVTFTIDTGKPVFQRYLANWPLEPGGAYEWSIFGNLGGIVGDSYQSIYNATWFSKFWTAPGVSPRAFATSFGSNYNHGYGAPNGFFTLIIAPDAE